VEGCSSSDPYYPALSESTRLQPRCREIEEGAQLEWQEPPSGIDETDGQGFRLELLKDKGERAGPSRAIW
jgi:hypothetical protein